MSADRQGVAPAAASLMAGLLGAATVVIGVSVLGLTGFTAAWACTSTVPVYSVTPRQGPVGTVITLTGSNFSADPVEVRWGSATGPKIASAQGPEFSGVTARIPDVAPGNYFIKVVARQSDGTIWDRSPAAQSFVVTGSSSPPPGGGAQNPPPADPPASPPEPSGSSGTIGSGTAPAGTTGEPGPAPDVASALRSELEGGPRRSSPVAPGTDRTTSGAPVGDRNALASRGPARPTETGVAILEQGPAPAAPDASATEGSSLADRGGSMNSVASDLWSGFGSGSASTRGASLTPASTTASSSGLGYGIGLLVAGTAGSVVALAVMTGRRRARARVSSRQN